MPPETGRAAAGQAAASTVPSHFLQCNQSIEPSVDGKLCLEFSFLLVGCVEKIICIDISLLVWCPGKIFPAVS